MSIAAVDDVRSGQNHLTIGSSPSTKLRQVRIIFSQPMKELISNGQKRHNVGSQVFAWLLAFRIFNAFFVRTFFQPDEYFQCLEPAWRVVFGTESGAWITWEWNYQLRSTIHPYLFAAVYYIADRFASLMSISNAPRAELLLAAPKLLQAILAATSDLYTWKLGKLIYGPDTYESWVSLILALLNPFHFFVITRTLSNCLELVLNTIAIYMWFTCAPDESNGSDQFDDGSSRTDLSMSKDELRDNSKTDDVIALRLRAGKLATSTLKIKKFVSNNVPTQASDRLRLCLILAAITCVLRVTNLITWITLASFEFVDFGTNWVSVVQTTRMSILFPTFRPRIRLWNRAHWVLLREAAICGILVLAASIVLDYTFYDEWTFPPIQFLRFNISEGISEFYGVNDVSWYFVQGFPLLLGAFLPFAMQAIYQHLVDQCHDEQDMVSIIRTELAAVALFVPIAFSFVAHKEVRFIYPILPILHLLAAGPVADFFGPILIYRPLAPKSGVTVWKYAMFYGILFLNFMTAVVISQFHQRAPLSVMDFLRHEHETYYLSQPPVTTGLALADTTMTVGFLMPCHSTPWRSHLVYPGIKGWALGCEPPIGLGIDERKTYRDEADLFYDDPVGFLRDTFRETGFAAASSHTQEVWEHDGSNETMGWDGRLGQKLWPDYLVFFAEKEDLLRDVLKKANYTQCWRGWNSWFHDDWRRRGDIIVRCSEDVSRLKS